MKKCLVFDVESAGLHGEGFAFGWVVVNEAGDVIEAGSASSGIDSVPCSPEDREWLAKNLPEYILHPEPSVRRTLAELREMFSTLLALHADAEVVVDCGYPVETSWLKGCGAKVYPLHELATVLKMAGMDPLGTYDRLPNELPKHDPLCDARQSARLWFLANHHILTLAAQNKRRGEALERCRVYLAACDLSDEDWETQEKLAQMCEEALK